MGAVGAAAVATAVAPGKTGAQPHAGETYKLVREIPVEEGYDLVVAGGGPAGAAAAISAARLGAKVLLVEATGCMGGMGTSGLMMAFCPVGDGERCLTGGLMREYLETLHSRGSLKPGLDPNDWCRQRWIPFNAEGLKLLLDELAVGAGVEVRFFTELIDVDADTRAGHVRGVVIQNVEGYRYIRAGTFIDGTGNGVLAKLCGATCREAGRDTPGIMPPTLVSMCSGIDWDRVGNQQAALQKAFEDHIFKVPDRSAPGMIQTGHGIGLLNAGHIYDLDALRCKSMTDGMMAGRRLAQEYIAIYRRYVSGCQNLEHVTTAPLMGGAGVAACARGIRVERGGLPLASTIPRSDRRLQLPHRYPSVQPECVWVCPEGVSIKNETGRIGGASVRHDGAEGVEEPVGGGPLRLHGRGGTRGVPGAARGSDDGTGGGDGSGTVHPHQAARGGDRYRGPSGHTAQGGSVPAANQDEQDHDPRCLITPGLSRRG